MKRYVGRRAKPRLSQWCATRSFPYEEGVYRGERLVSMRRYRISGHVVCGGQRWHRRDHLECCGTDDELESYACQCPCHLPGSRAGGGPR